MEYFLERKKFGLMFLASYFGISGDLVNHASYVAAWKKYLDARAVGRAMSQASKAFSWLIAQFEEKKIEAAKAAFFNIIDFKDDFVLEIYHQVVYIYKCREMICEY